jgi:hypothetical protein
VFTNLIYRQLLRRNTIHIHLSLIVITLITQFLISNPLRQTIMLLLLMFLIIIISNIGNQMPLHHSSNMKIFFTIAINNIFSNLELPITMLLLFLTIIITTTINSSRPMLQTITLLIIIITLQTIILVVK